ncbi:MAG: ParA family protein [Lachnospiraceae bacterium]
MKVISISNVKGGVGKTTTAAVLSAGLTAKGYKVLMIDSDPQTNLTMCFRQEPPDEAPSLYHVYSEGKRLDEVKETIKPGLDLVIGDFELCNADMQFLKAGRLKMLSKAFKNLEKGYDVVVIDTPPNLGILSLNAFLVSDYIVVPMAADSFSLKGIRLLKQTLDEVQEETEKDISITGLLLTKYSDRTNVAKLLENSIQSAAELLNTKVFDSRIRQATVLQESQIAKIDLLEYAPKAPVSADYRAFINELLERIEV